MKQILFAVVFLMLACAGTKNKKQNLAGIEVKEISYGICQTTTLYKNAMEGSPSGNQILSHGFKLIRKTDRIPGFVGQKFGMEYLIESPVKEDITLEQVWIFPTTIRDNNGKEFKTLRYPVMKSTREESYSTYEFEKDYEVVKGEWIFQMFYKGEKLYERKFYVE